MERMPSTNDRGADWVVEHARADDRCVVTTSRPKETVAAVAGRAGWSP